MEITLIKDLKVGLRNVNVIFIVLEVGQKTVLAKDGTEIRNCKIADRSASIALSIWGPLGNYIQPGDICRLYRGFVASWKGTPTLYVGKGGELTKSGEFCLIFNESINMSDPAQNKETPIEVE